MPEAYFLADIDFCPCCPTRGVHLPVQCNPSDLKIHYSMEILETSTNHKKMKSEKTRRISLFQDLQKNSPPKWNAYFISKFVPLDTISL